MTVSELIEQLKNMPQDMMVVIDGYEGGYDNPELSSSKLIPDSNWNGKSKEAWYNGRHDVYYVEMEDQNLSTVECVVIGRGK
jgi:hypothetical protein